MFSAIGFVLKAGVFALLVLVLGHVIRWDGKTISDQVRTHLSIAERADIARRVRGVASGLTEDSARGARAKASDTETGAREIAPSERQKLRALIDELNRAH